MHATLAIFRHLTNVIPPLVPDTLVVTMKKALDHFESHPEATLEELERVMYAYGYELWPYNQAFREELLLAEKNVGERFLLPKLSVGLKEKYLDYKKQGGTIRELHSGSGVAVFSSEERVELCEVLVGLQHDLRQYATQHVLGVGKKRYFSHIEHFRSRLETMHTYIEKLRHLADHEDEHPTLAEEIRAQVKSFEQGLCLLGPELSYEAVCSSVDYFQGRQKQSRYFKHLYQPKIVEYFS
jgi:hypothetical protein